MRHTLLRFTLLSLFALWFAPAVTAGEDKIKDIVRTGKGIVLLAGDVGLTAGDLAKTSKWTFFVQLSKAKADALRKDLDRDGLLGNRVYVQDGVASLYLADDLADAVAVSNDVTVAETEVLRVLRPRAKRLSAARR